MNPKERCRLRDEVIATNAAWHAARDNLVAARAAWRAARDAWKASYKDKPPGQIRMPPPRRVCKTEQIIALAASGGMTAKEIAIATSAHLSMVYAVARKIGCRLHRPARCQATANRAAAEAGIRAGRSYKDIGVELGVSKERVRQYARDLGIEAVTARRVVQERNAERAQAEADARAARRAFEMDREAQLVALVTDAG